MNMRANWLRAISVCLICLANPTQVFAIAWENMDEAAAFDAGDVAAVKRILAKANYSGEQRIEALEHAILNGRVELVKYLDTRGWLDECRKAPNCHTLDWGTDSVEMVRYLLSKGFPATNDALRGAAGSGNLEAVRLLCQHGANTSTKSTYEHFTYRRSRYVRRNGTESYSYAWEKLGKRDATALETLKDRPSYWEEVAQSAPPHNLLSNARSSAGIVKVTELLESGRCRRDANALSRPDIYEQEVTALRQSDIDSVKSLFSSRDVETIHPVVLVYLFYEAIASGSIDLLHYLHSIGWLERCRATSYCHPVAVAAQVGANDKVLEFLLSEGFAVDRYVGDYGTPLHYAALSGHPRVVRFLCLHGANPRNSVGSGGDERSLLHELRELYGNAWCILNARKNRAAREACDSNLPSSIPEPACSPGATCLSIAFTSEGSQKDVQRLKDVTAIFHHLRDGACNASVARQCPAPPAKQDTAAVIWDRVRLRSDSSAVSSTVVATLEYGAELTVVESRRDCETIDGRTGRWVKVSAYVPTVDSAPIAKEGWIFDAFVDYSPSSNR